MALGLASCVGDDETSGGAGAGATGGTSAGGSTTTANGGAGGYGAGGAGGAHRPTVVDVQPLKATDGGRVDWCDGAELIAFDTIDASLNWQVHTVRPDGTDEQCLTCSTPGLPATVRGQPAFHPGCEFLVIQVKDLDAPDPPGVPARYFGPGWGIKSELWVLRADGSEAFELVTLQQPTEASLHPHFSAAGDQLFWTARDVTSAAGFPWSGWYLIVAPFSFPPAGVPTVGARQDIFRTGAPDDRGFFESHELAEATLWFSRTDDGQPFVDEGFRAPLADPNAATNLTQAPGGWDEHVAPSPGGQLVAFNSSRAGDFQHPPDAFPELSMEIFALVVATGEVVQLTHFGDALSSGDQAAGIEVVTSDYDWAPSGDRLAVYWVRKEPTGAILSQHIDLVTLDRAY